MEGIMSSATPIKKKNSGNPHRRSRSSTANPSGREKMIAVAAYFRAEHRGFQPDNELEDWLESEAEIDSHLRGK
jgi:hypothetical protein